MFAKRRKTVGLLAGALALALLLGGCSLSVESVMEDLKAYVKGEEATESTGPAEGFVESRENGDYAYDVYDDHVVLTGYKGESAYVTVPDTLDGLPVTVIGGLAFYYGKPVENVKLPSTVTELAENAFYYCRSLKHLELPDSLVTLGDKCFSWCSSLTALTLPSGVTELPDYCFNECSGLEWLTLPDGITSVGVRAFSGCKLLAKVSFGSSLTSVGALAFRDCVSLPVLTLPGGCKVGRDAFLGCAESFGVVTVRDSVCWQALWNMGVPVGTSETTLTRNPNPVDPDESNVSETSDTSETSETSDTSDTTTETTATE